jgi:hypothetical protein
LRRYSNPDPASNNLQILASFPWKRKLSLTKLLESLTSPTPLLPLFTRPVLRRLLHLRCVLGFELLALVGVDDLQMCKRLGCGGNEGFPRY